MSEKYIDYKKKYEKYHKKIIKLLNSLWDLPAILSVVYLNWNLLGNETPFYPTFGFSLVLY